MAFASGPVSYQRFYVNGSIPEEITKPVFLVAKGGEGTKRIVGNHRIDFIRQKHLNTLIIGFGRHQLGFWCGFLCKGLTG